MNTIEEIRICEDKLSVKLPQSFVNYLTGSDNKDDDGYVYKITCTIPEELKYYLGDGYIDINKLNDATLNEHGVNTILCSHYMIEEWELPQDLVLLQGDGHTWIALDYRKGEDPPVIFIESDECYSLLIAENF